MNTTIIHVERVCSQTQLCQLRCFNDCTRRIVIIVIKTS